MKIKTLFLVLFASILASLALVSALTLSGDSVTILTTDTSKALTITGDSLFNMTLPVLAAMNETTFTISNTTSILNTTSATLSIVPSFPATFTFGKSASGILTINAVNASDGAAASKNITITIKNEKFCSNSNPGVLSIDELEFNVLEGFGDDEDYWYPLDDVKVSFNLENTGDYDVEDVEIKACLLDTETGKCVFDEDDMDISEDSFDIDSDDELDVELTFNIDPDNLKAGNKAYVLYVSAEGEVDDSDSPNDGQPSCVSDSKDIEIRTDDEFTIIKNTEVPETVSCGSTFDLTADLWNIWDEDIDHDNVFVFIYNQALGIKQTIKFNEDLESFDKQTISIQGLTVPKNASAKTYTLEMSVYNDDSLSTNDMYQTSEDDDAMFTIPLKVECQPATKNVTITADFSADTPNAVIGKQVILDGTITNTGNSASLYLVEVTGNSAWSKATVDPRTMTLNAGASADFKIYLDIDSAAEAEEQEFKIKVTSEGQVIKEYTVPIALEKGLSSSAIVQHLKRNWYIYAIVLVNIILIIAIIVAIARILRKH